MEWGPSKHDVRRNVTFLFHLPLFFNELSGYLFCLSSATFFSQHLIVSILTLLVHCICEDLPCSRDYEGRASCWDKEFFCHFFFVM